MFKTVIFSLLSLYLTLRMVNLLAKLMFGMDNAIQIGIKLFLSELQSLEEPRTRRTELITLSISVVLSLLMFVALSLSAFSVWITAVIHNGEKGVFLLQILALAYGLFCAILAQFMLGNGKREWRAFIELLNDRR